MLIQGREGVKRHSTTNEVCQGLSDMNVNSNYKDGKEHASKRRKVKKVQCVSETNSI